MMFRRALGLAAVVLAMSGGQAFAQTADENRDADALAADMRILAANPLDIEALVTAGELTLKMGDNTAAAGFFGRAEKLDPLNPRVKAGLGSLLVRAERPGEALRRFQEAEARGLDPSKYAADRGLAYDLIGEQERAQRDYRLALRKGPDDEITRRYALSMGISGRKKEALDLLDALLRKSDRAAWRDRAFILAMSGDREGAQKIANSMMSPGLGAGLAPFFDRLPMLSAADRAFAVNFGELRATPERLADARMVPALPRLGPDPTAPKVLAVAEQPKPRPTVQDDTRKHKKRKKDEDLAPVVPAPKPAAPVEVAMNPPSYIPPRGTPTPPPPPSPQPSPRVIYAAPLPSPKPATGLTPAPTPLPPPVKVAEIFETHSRTHHDGSGTVARTSGGRRRAGSGSRLQRCQCRSRPSRPPDRRRGGDQSGADRDLPCQRGHGAGQDHRWYLRAWFGTRGRAAADARRSAATASGAQTGRSCA